MERERETETERTEGSALEMWAVLRDFSPPFLFAERVSHSTAFPSADRSASPSAHADNRTR